MITKMGKKAWDFLTQGKLTDEWFDTDTVTVNGVIVNRENYGVCSAYTGRYKETPIAFHIFDRRASTSPIESNYSGDVLISQFFPYHRNSEISNTTTINKSYIAQTPFIYGNDYDYVTKRCIYFGSSDADYSDEDYWLKSWLENVWVHRWDTNTVKKDGANVSRLSIYNANDDEVTIKEMCCCIGWIFCDRKTDGPSTVSSATNMTEAAAPFIMIDRTVLETPLVIPAKSIGYMVLS